MRAIDGDRLKRKAQKVATEAWKMKTKATVEVILNQFIDWINEAPTIEPDSDTVSRQQAEMIQESYYSDKLVCSNCGIEARWDYEFCPYCGFKFKQTGGAV